MKRGDVVVVAAGGGFGGKPRPALIVQDDAFAELDTVVLALFTTGLVGGGPIRPRFEPSPQNGLNEPSELMAHVVLTARREKVGGVIGRLNEEEMARAERALFALLGLAG